MNRRGMLSFAMLGVVVLVGCGSRTSLGEVGSAPRASDAGPATTLPASDGGCSVGSAASAATAQSLDLFGQIVYFAGGAALPAGRYEVRYVDGCMKYSAAQDWTVNAYAGSNPDGWWLVGSTPADRIAVPPGTVGYLVSNGGFATFEECVAANLTLPPVEFEFAGGPIGVWLSDNPYLDNVSGQAGRNPKWALAYEAPCP